MFRLVLSECQKMHGVPLFRLVETSVLCACACCVLVLLFYSVRLVYSKRRKLAWYSSLSLTGCLSFSLVYVTGLALNDMLLLTHSLPQKCKFLSWPVSYVYMHMSLAIHVYACVCIYVYACVKKVSCAYHACVCIGFT